MPETAADRLNRLVSLVADLTRRERDGTPAPTLADLARRYGVTVADIRTDLRTLTLLGDDPNADWLLSLRVWQEGNRVSLASHGPYRRPIRFTPDEALALSVGLACERSEVCEALARRLAALQSGDPDDPPVALAAPGSDVVDLLRRCVPARRRVEILYTGDGDRAGAARVIDPYQVVSSDGHTYVVAWCERANGWRHFRLDRVLDALPADGTFEARTDFAAVESGEDVFQEPDGGADDVRVRFTPAVARWIRERHPDAERAPDGSVVVTYRVANPHWLVRHVLEYGPDAEVLGPEAYREAMYAAVARPPRG